MRVLTHQFVVGELAGGNLRSRREVLGLFRRLPAAPTATQTEVSPSSNDARCSADSR